MDQHKEERIQEAGMKLFSEKGFEATSVQDIVDECGISKGSFYSYFKSKDALLVTILTHHYRMIEKRIQEVDHMKLQPRETFIVQLTHLYEGIYKHREFIITYAYEQITRLNATVKRRILHIQTKRRAFYRRGLQMIYGEQVTPYLWDLAIMLEGIAHTFIRMLLQNGRELQIEKLVKYIVNRIDNIVEGMINSNEKPLLQESDVNPPRNMGNVSLTGARLTELVTIIKDELRKSSQNENYLVSLDVIEEELDRETPRYPVIKGMLSNLEDINIKEVEIYIEELKRSL
ncbi:TetR/AcrR family transcriptional regulator [Salipaludibacillus agaradhaerens]|uniref:TetR/AcrR family transcriptional regulator n=1 Tax=Salipaludibacillus agaradhaerens TaxID=76935 RepID=UPI000996CCCB|nr:TetR/AcrR family transcriptional regulator [Salipaludibacillus agaradhaerens]